MVSGNHKNNKITLGDICCAIMDNLLPATRDGGQCFEIKTLDLIRAFRSKKAIPAYAVVPKRLHKR